MHAQLIPIDGSPPIEIVKDLTLIGRREDCDLRLDYKSVSKMHCIMVKTDGLLLIRDLGSTNGTRVNGQRIRRAALLPSDQLSIANFKFRVALGPDQLASASSNDRTQQLNALEIAEVLHAAQSAHADSSLPPLQPKSLPDVYPDERAHS